MYAQVDLIEFLTANDIVPVAYSPIGRYNSTRAPSLDILSHDKTGLLEKLATKYEKSAIQIMLNWGLCRGYVVIPKASSLTHQKANFEAQGFRLKDDEVKQITEQFDCGEILFKSTTGSFNVFV